MEGNLFIVKLCSFLSFLAFTVSQGTNPSLNDDVLGLIVFKFDLHDPKNVLSSWSEDDNSPCNWFGIQCNPRTQRVTEILLNDLSLSGKIGRGLVRLQFLRKLSLSNNYFSGTISPDLATIQSLRAVDFSGNNLTGEIPDQFFKQCGSLRYVSFARNNFYGPVPRSLTSCSSISVLNFSSNHLSGSLPEDIWSLNTLRDLDLSGNELTGNIPVGIGSSFNLRTVNLRKNQISGNLPEDIGKCLLLNSMDFSENSLTGTVPVSLQRLSLLTSLKLGKNSITGLIPSWISMLKNLEVLDLSGNMFSGEVPTSIGELKMLKSLSLSGNKFTGQIPDSLTMCVHLSEVDLSQNGLIGIIPEGILASSIERLNLSQNGFTGSIPDITGSNVFYQSVKVIDLSENGLSGKIPEAFALSSQLVVLNLSRNFLSSEIPAGIGELKELEVLDLSQNRLNGSIPLKIGAAIALTDLRLDRNFLSGGIPLEIGKLRSLGTLSLSKNNLSGPLPASLANLTSLHTLDLSFNNLTGTLPHQLGNLPHLLFLNLSHNNLAGELPMGPAFNTLDPTSLSGNPSLCGALLNRSCPAVLPKPIVLNPDSTPNSPQNSLPTTKSTSRHKKIILSISTLVAISAAALIALGVVTVTLLNMNARAHHRADGALVLEPSRSGSGSGVGSPLTSTGSGQPGKLVMFSSDKDFSVGAHALLDKHCELGRGGFGAVYRAPLPDGRPVAVKKLAVSGLVKSQSEFEKTVRSLGRLRHPNLVHLHGYYWTPQLQLLVYEYVGGGSLYSRLHEPGGKALTWLERFRVILGVARGLAFLHESCRPAVVHYNVKSSNVLIDENGEAKVGDFGLARLLPMLDRYVLSSKIQSALGYMAPEFACGSARVSEKCDVYGFGVLTLEIITGRRPVEYTEDDVVILSDSVRGALEGGRVGSCVDPRMGPAWPEEVLVPLVKLALICASQVPSNRPAMGEVVHILEVIGSPPGPKEES
ncbi:hypothetical protein AMTRI_Chr08g168150 [Amborella trichopoda]|uniref:Protein kinase domain-containing protein n=1 Tax=Amborella trichopoda TaxID=13333 RepID=W1P8D6_AMBTC|nr:probable LRR receptor-like serine/threonine-protein kinase IRK [Amborella trichopoda]ERN04168.1 hypothetical protein AMTR_s00077p00091370 [Amborella trichopoda]|eukprot:XP_006842493.1 probable LRR receptor-like serine/threonine-protein kinase IRK [Amborella trichopoda]